MSHPLVKENAKLAALIEELKREHLEMQGALLAAARTVNQLQDHYEQQLVMARRALEEEHLRHCLGCQSRVHGVKEQWGQN